MRDMTIREGDIIRKHFLTKKQSIILNYITNKMDNKDSYVDFNMIDLHKALPSVTSGGSMRHHIKNLHKQGALEVKKVGKRNKYKVEPDVYRVYHNACHTSQV